MDQYTNMSDELDPLRDPAPRRPSRRIMSSRRQRSRARQSSEPAASPSPSGRSATRQSHSSSQSHARESRSSGASQCQQTHQSHTRSHREEEYSLSFSADGYTSQRQSASHASNQDGPVHQQQQQEQEPDPFVSGSSPPTYGGAVSIQAQIERLKLKGFSTGLARELAANTPAFAYRIWVVDNSGSMEINDGHRIIPKSDGKIKQQRVSRWQELEETVMYHAEMAGILEAPTLFRLLNDPGPQVGPQEYQIRPANATEDIRKLGLAMYKAEPNGMTPLTSHILQIQQMLHRMAPQLRREGKRVAVILATDGLPTDEEGYGGEEITNEFVQALQSMEGLPIWLVIRLCTDEEKVTEFYNTLDGRFELSLEVLDDFLGEAAEVFQHNSWLNYSLPIHRCRELGYHDRLFDLIDERALTKGELRDFCALLFGVDSFKIPDPNVDWKDFSRYVQEALVAEPNQYDPIKKKVLPLIHIRALNRKYGKGGGNCSVM